MLLGAVMMQSFVKHVYRKHTVMHIDNKNSIVKIGTKKPILQDISLRINCLCSDNLIISFPRWLPREENIGIKMGPT